MRRRAPAGLDMQAPVGAQPPKRIVDPPASGHQLLFGAAGQVRAAEGDSLLQGAILVDDQAFAEEEGPGQQIGQDGRTALIFADASACWNKHRY